MALVLDGLTPTERSRLLDRYGTPDYRRYQEALSADGVGQMIRAATGPGAILRIDILTRVPDTVAHTLLDARCSRQRWPVNPCLPG